MRLVCPNCDAKYEVPEDAIPDVGRDVQCANCNHAWFQTRNRPASPAIVTTQPEPAAKSVAVPDAVAEADTAPPVAAETAPEEAQPQERAASTGKPKSAAKTAAAPVEPPAAISETPETAPVAETVMTEDPVATSDPVSALFSASVPTDPAPAIAVADPAPDAEIWPEMTEESETASPVPARAVDESVLTILREEAEREAKARRGDGSALDDLPDNAVGAPPARKKGAGKKAAPEPVEVAKSAARRDLLPDVEEINSTLRPSEMPEPEFVGDPETVLREEGGSFRAGFLLVLAAAILGGAIYIASAWLANLIPALEGPLAAYVGLIDGVRLSLDSLMQSATQLISGEQG